MPNPEKADPWFILSLKFGRGASATRIHIHGGPRSLSVVVVLIGILASPDFGSFIHALLNARG